jgi:hypothetical protein
LLSWTCPWKVRGRPLGSNRGLGGQPWLLQLAGDRDTIRAFAAACEIRFCAGCFLTSSRQLRARWRSCRARCGVFCVRNSAARLMSRVVSAPRIADSNRDVSEAGPCAIATWVVPPPTKASSEIPRCTPRPLLEHREVERSDARRPQNEVSQSTKQGRRNASGCLIGAASLIDLTTTRRGRSARYLPLVSAFRRSRQFNLGHGV